MNTKTVADQVSLNVGKYHYCLRFIRCKLILSSEMFGILPEGGGAGELPRPFWQLEILW